jgi:Lipid desaturase domain
MVNQELDYEIPRRPVVCAWVSLALLMTVIGIWSYPLTAMIAFSCVIVIWMNLYSTVLHYALDAEEFTKLPVVGGAIVTFQSHHFPRWINTIHRKPVVDLLGELTPIAVLNLLVPLLIFQFRHREVFVAWGILMLVACYATLCHRWAHQPAGARSKIATMLQCAHLALSPTEHMRHHAQATSAQAGFVPNFDVSFGWSNALFNRAFKALPSPRLWLVVLIVGTLTQVSGLAMLLYWLRS